jgi:hypothetical protein
MRMGMGMGKAMESKPINPFVVCGFGLGFGFGFGFGNRNDLIGLDRIEFDVPTFIDLLLRFTVTFGSGQIQIQIRIHSYIELAKAIDRYRSDLFSILDTVCCRAIVV